MQISPEVMHSQVGRSTNSSGRIGYESVFIEGKAESRRYMQRAFSRLAGENITSVLHEKRGGMRITWRRCAVLAQKAEAEGVEIITGVEVTGFRLINGAIDGERR
jgi:flavin-dependent dehydrogenase